MKPTIIHCFYDADMRCSHQGLSLLAKKEGVHIERLKQGRFVCFINAKGDRVKLLTTENVLVYLKSKERITEEQIRSIPKLFYGSTFNFKKALDLGLREAA